MNPNTSNGAIQKNKRAPSHRIYKLGEKGSGTRKMSEIQDFYELRDKCFEEGRLFEDPTFAAVDSNISSRQELSEKYQWKRPRDIDVNDPKFLEEGFSRFDVIQGQLGDCWLVAAMSNLTLNPVLFHNVVPDDQGFDANKKYAGIFHFRFWQLGKWIDVVVDDRLPTHRDELVFLHSKVQNKFWSALLEKAYAKLHGSYELLTTGKASEAMIDFTGGLLETYELQNAPSTLFTTMNKAHERSSLMACSIEYDATTERKLPSGLRIGHSYSINNVSLVDVETSLTSEKIPLLRLRNPWGDDAEWNGAWSYGSPEWKLVSENEKKSLGLDTAAAADGEFWMSLSDFVKNFHDLEICHVHLGSLEGDEKRPSQKRWECKSFENSWKKGVTAGGCRNFKDTFACNPQYRIVLEDPDDNDDEKTCTLIIALTQKITRTDKKKGVLPLTIGYEIYRLEKPDSLPRPLPWSYFERHNCVAEVQKFTNEREVIHRFNLLPGTYCIVPSTFNQNEERDFLLRVYTEKINNLNKNDGEISLISADKNTAKDETQRDSSGVLFSAFRRIAGENLEVDAKELKTVFDSVLEKEFNFPGFGHNFCSGIVRMMDSDHSGKLKFQKFKELWSNIAIWKDVFTLHDKTDTGTFNSFELREALASAGFSLNSRTLTILTLRFANENNEVTFEDFITCAVKLKTMIEAFKERDSDGRSEALFKFDEWITLTMYA